MQWDLEAQAIKAIYEKDKLGEIPYTIKELSEKLGVDKKKLVDVLRRLADEGVLVWKSYYSNVEYAKGKYIPCGCFYQLKKGK